MPVSIDMLGSVQDPDWNSWRPGAGARGRRRAEGRLQPEAEGLGVERHDDIAIGRHRVLDRRQRIAAVAEKLRVQQRLLRPERGAGEGHRVKPLAGGVP
jgi:hypothetical protein